MELGCNQYVLIVVASIGSSCLATVSKYLSQKKCSGSSVGQAILATTVYVVRWS